MPPPSQSTKASRPQINAASTCTLPPIIICRPYTDHVRTVDSFLNSRPPPPALPSASSSRSASPAFQNGNKSPYQMPSRSATSPLPKPASLASPDLSISQDCAFPPFPTTKSRSATPTTPLEPSFPLSDRHKPPERSGFDTSYTPPSSRGTAGGSGMSYLNTVASGSSRAGEQSFSQQSGHEESTFMSNSQDFMRPTSSGGFISHHYKRPSTSSSNYTRRPSVSSTSGSSRFTLERSKTEIPSVPTVPPPGIRPHQEESSSVNNEHHPSDSAFDFGSFGPGHRSQTFPTDGEGSKRSDEQRSFSRRPSEPSTHSHKPKPSVAAAVMKPLNSIGSTSSFKPSKSQRGRNTAPAVDQTATSAPKGLSDAMDERRTEDAPPLPMHAQVQKFESDNPHHTPTESTSSNESFSSGGKTGSSRSSPPLYDSPQRSKGRSPNNGRIDDLFNGFQFDVERRPSFEKPSTMKEEIRTGYSEARPAKPSPSTRPTIPTLSPYEEIPRREETPLTSPEDYIVSSFAPHSENLKTSPAPPSPDPPPASGGFSQQRPTISKKGNCRGCGESIKGKSVRAEDGRQLTGRYHKQCFVCKTCQAPFQTADFYVMHNHPYCARHYHELNDSLCKRCDRGIEGPYLETEQKQKFHPHCFSCQECHRILRKDYFEFDGRTLCEQHAHRAAQQPSSLGPGRRFPERRTTRLMMM